LRTASTSAHDGLHCAKNDVRHERAQSQPGRGSFSIRLLALVCDTYREGSRCECLRAPLDQLRARELAKAHGHGGPLDGHTHALNRDLHGLLVQRGRRHPRTCKVREVNCFSNGADNDFGFLFIFIRDIYMQ